MNRKEVIASLFGGKIRTISYVKKNGQSRNINCRLGVTKHLVGGEKPYEDSDHNIVTVFDMQKREYRSLKVENITSVK